MYEQPAEQTGSDSGDSANSQQPESWTWTFNAPRGPRGPYPARSSFFGSSTAATTTPRYGTPVSFGPSTATPANRYNQPAVSFGSSAGTLANRYLPAVSFGPSSMATTPRYGVPIISSSSGEDEDNQQTRISSNAYGRFSRFGPRSSLGRRPFFYGR